MKRGALANLAIYGAALALALFTLAPLVWLGLMSVMSPTDLVRLPLQWLPSEWDFSRYARLVSAIGTQETDRFLAAMRNSVFTAAGASLIAVTAGTLAAYAFARRGAPIVLLFAMMATIMMPPITYVLPLYTSFSSLGMLNSIVTLIVVYCALIVPFAAWLMRANIATLPVEVEYAAAVEGASTWLTLRRIVLPMARPALAATAMLSFLIAWDEFFYALIFTSDLRAKTLPVAIADFAAGRVTDYGLIATVGVLAALPPALLALFFQKHLVSGLAAGSVKG